MNTGSKVITQFFFIMGAIALALITVIGMVTDAQGALAALTPLITIVLALIAFFKPHTGLYVLIPLVIWVDEYKRLAVYFGGAFSMTVYQTLAMPFIVLGALNAGYLINFIVNRKKIDPIIIIVYSMAALVGGGIFFTMDAGIAERGQRAANIAGFITLIPIAYTYLKSFDQWRKFFAMQVLFALPAALWAIYQYHYGFNLIEMTYAMSGLSRVHTSQMLMPNPRVFGFFGSASALGCASIYCAFAYWHALRYSKRRIVWSVIALLLTYVLVVSTQRTALVYPAIVLFANFAFRTRPRVLLTYTTALTLFVTGVFSAKYLLNEGLEKINDAIAVESGWGANVLNVSTFSDRLRGWERLGRAKSWSLFGTGSEAVGGAAASFDVNSDDYSHDIINKVLIRYGAFGILVVAVLGGSLIYYLHKIPFDSGNKQERNDAAFALALALPIVGLSFVGGDNFNTNPINLQIWTSFSGVLVCRSVFILSRKEKRLLLRRQIEADLEAARLDEAPLPITRRPQAFS